MTTLTNKVGLTATRSARNNNNNNNNRALLFSSSSRGRDQKNPLWMMMRVHPQSCERFRHHHHHHHHCRGRRHRRIIIACESSSFGDAENALVVFAALVASRVVARSNAHDDDDGKAGVFASAVVAPTWIVRWCRGDRGTTFFSVCFNDLLVT